jgi:hypothetical protein
MDGVLRRVGDLRVPQMGRLDVLPWHLSLTPERLDGPYMRPFIPALPGSMKSMKLLVYNVFGAFPDKGYILDARRYVATPLAPRDSRWRPVAIVLSPEHTDGVRPVIKCVRLVTWLTTAGAADC